MVYVNYEWATKQTHFLGYHHLISLLERATKVNGKNEKKNFKNIAGKCSPKLGFPYLTNVILFELNYEHSDHVR